MPTSAASHTAADTVAVCAPQPPRGSAPVAVTSSSFKNGDTLSNAHVFTGCGGKNVSPQLSWTGAPAETKSYAVTLFDPDAPTGCGYWHWLACDIPASVTSLEAGAGGGESPAGGKTGYNDFGMNSYGGPCPPKGDKPHRYIFTVYALDVPALENAGKSMTGATLVFLMRGHVLASGSITGLFGH
jgi:hypothetical protein